MSLYLKVKDYIALKYPNVINEYSEWIISHGNYTFMKKIQGYFFLLTLLIQKDRRTAKVKKGEYEDSKRQDINELIEQILKYDVVSFDVFDTLILRNVEKPEDVFEIVEHKLNISAFSIARKRAENELWIKGNYNIFDIYKKLEKLRNIEANSWKVELDAEMSVCCANLYIQQVYNAAIKAGKIVIATSDMYWPKSYIEKLLALNGYDYFNEIFISCDVGKSKQDGELFTWLKKNKYSDKTIIHIGDNYDSDIFQARRKGIKAIQYRSVRDKGMQYRMRCQGQNSIGLSICNAIINNKIHNGVCDFDQYVQFGYIYGGLLVAGYCKFIHKVVQEKKIEKILFLARDADVVCKAYQYYYGIDNSAYVYVSRNAVAQLAFERYPDYFIEQVIKLRFIDNTKTYKLKEVLEQSGLQCLEEYLEEAGLKKEQVFTNIEAELLNNLIYQYKNVIANAFEPTRKAAYLYWKDVISECKKIALVDVGWQASTHMCLNYFLNEICNFQCQLYTVQFATIRSKWNKMLYDKGRLISYCFSTDFNKQYLEKVLYNERRKGVVEIIFTAIHPTLMSYILDENNRVTLLFAKSIKDNVEITNKVQKGILEFVSIFKQIEDKIGIDLSLYGEEAFGPLYSVIEQKKYIRNLFGSYKYGNVPCDADIKDFSHIIK